VTLGLTDACSGRVPRHSWLARALSLRVAGHAAKAQVRYPPYRSRSSEGCMKTHKQVRRRPGSPDAIFRRRAERLQSECGWCGGSIGEDEPVFGIGGKALPGIDLSLVQGKVIEITLESAGKSVLAAVSAFESDAKRAGNDLMFMVCSEACGRNLQTAIAAEVARGG
jgi:hypothetical protein